MVRKATIQDAGFINEIYNQNISEESVANCHLTKTSEKYWADIVADPKAIFAVKETTDGKISGWGCLKPLSIREIYDGICELSIYVNLENQNGTVAYQLYKYLLQKAREKNYKQISALVLEENVRSSKMLYKDNFVKAVELPGVAIKNNKMVNLNLLCKKL